MGEQTTGTLKVLTEIAPMRREVRAVLNNMSQGGVRVAVSQDNRKGTDSSCNFDRPFSRE